MAASRSAVDVIFVPISRALTAVAAQLGVDGGAELLGRLGYKVPAASDLGALFSDLGGAADELEQVLQRIGQAYEDGSHMDPAFLQVMLELTGNVAEFVAVAAALPARAETAFAAAPEFLANAPLAELPRRLVDYLVAGHLRSDYPRITATLELLGIIAHFYVPEGTYNPAFFQVAIRWERFGTWLSSPGEVFAAEYRWGSAGFSDDVLLERLQGLLWLLGVRASSAPVPAIDGGDDQTTAQLELALYSGTVEIADDGLVGVDMGVRLRRIDDPADADNAGLALVPYVDGGIDVNLPLREGWTLTFSSAVNTEAIELTVLPKTGLRLDGAGAVVGTVGFRLHRDGTTLGALTLIGDITGTRLQIGEIGLVIAAAIDSRGVDVGGEIALLDVALVVVANEGDGFLAKILPRDPLTIAFDLVVGASARRGLYISGGAGFEAEFPVHLSLLGVLAIESVYTAFTVDEIGLRVGFAATATLQLGPIVASVQRLGVQASIRFAAASGHPPAPVMEMALLPPRGVGMLIDAGVVKGGGFILNDPDNGRYAGILQLKIGDILTVTAIGLVTTRLPDGSKGFSLLIIITATFPPIQLGFGFTLAGLGGLLGLNRTMNVLALRDGVRTGVLDSILFPVDPVAHATKVISDIEAVFPVADGRFTIGLMARIGWGSPQIVTVDLGVIVEVPMPLRIALIGRVALILPKPDAAIVVLKLDVVGIIDFARSELSIDATLHDSRVAVFDVYGDMAVRVGWGSNPAFAISIGGFNPRFVPPAGFPQMRRLTIALATSENPSVRLETYLAVTSNTLQIGARLDAHAELNAGEVIGLFRAEAYFGFDALIVFHPFEFIVDLCGGIAIKRNGSPFISAELALTLSGPQPMRAVGYAEVHLLGTFRIPFDVTVGETQDIAATAAVDPLAELVAALGRIESWSAQPPTTEPAVALRDAPADALLAHPMGSLAFRQRVVPLGIRIDRYGGTPLAIPLSYAVSYVVGGVPATTTELRDAWAPGDLFALTDDEKITFPSFQQLVSGGSGIGAPEATHGVQRLGGEQAYETRVIDSDDRLSRPHLTYSVPATVESLLAAMAAGGLVASGTHGGPPMKVAVAEPSYTVTSTTDMSPVGGSHRSWVEADQADNTRPGRQIVGTHEVIG